MRLASAILLGLAASATADDRAPAPRPVGDGRIRHRLPRFYGDDPSPPRASYRTSLMLADAISSTVTAGGLAFYEAFEDGGGEIRISGVMLMFGLGGYVLAPPAIHYTHEEMDRMAVSTALRIGLPLAGASIAVQQAASTDEAYFYIAAGALTAMAIDYFLIAHD